MSDDGEKAGVTRESEMAPGAEIIDVREPDLPVSIDNNATSESDEEHR